MTNRIYNKLYVTKNRDDVSEKLVFGYQHDQKENIFNKNKETYFHIPAYTTALKLSETQLIANGAHGGGFPAASDRIFKSRKNYGNVTQHGTPTDVADGMWFCSWLYKNPENGVIQWMDRFYNPGKFDYSIAKSQLLEHPPYIQLDPIYRDVPSKMTLEPGVLYRYFHCGEQTFNELLTTFEGISSIKLDLHLLNWGEENVDRSPNKISPIVNTSVPVGNLYETPSETDRIFNPVIRFDNTSNVECFLNYSSAYNPTNEFTWSAWTHSNNWQDNVSTQILGNYSTLGGVGIFIDSLETYPFIAIPETNYGHVLFLNQNGDGYLDKSLQKNLFPVRPICFAIDSNDNVLVCNEDTAGVIYKMDHTGKIIRSTKNLSDPNTLFAFSLSGELPKRVLCGKNDDFYVISSKAIYTFTNELYLKQTIPQPFGENYSAAFLYDSATDTEELVISTNTYDSKFIETTKWSLSSTDGNLYKNSELFQRLPNIGTTLSVAPDNKIWVLHGKNEVSIIDPTLEAGKAIVDTLYVGTDKERSNEKKNITFINRFERLTNTRQWFALIYYSDEKQLYFYSLDGILNGVTDLSSLFRLDIIQRYEQDINSFEFLSNGDPTGYERKRVFNRLSPYNSKKQIALKASVKDLSKEALFYKTFKATASINEWNPNSWQHLLLTYKNKSFQLWSNGKHIFDLKIDGQYEISYESQPPFYIGGSVGNTLGLNNELGAVTSIFNGKIGDIRIFDYAIEKENIELFNKASIVSNDIYWPMPIPLTQYVEAVERVFKHKLPGAKSQFFNLKLKGTGIIDSLTKEIVENEIKEIVNDMKPSYTDLLKIEWI